MRCGSNFFDVGSLSPYEIFLQIRKFMIKNDFVEADLEVINCFCGF